MSMLSAQCDELRSMAESVGLAMPQAATLMMGAADAINRLDGENAKLRKLVVRMFHTIEWSDRMSDSMYWPSFSYERELRELGVDVDAE